MRIVEQWLSELVELPAGGDLEPTLLAAGVEVEQTLGDTKAGRSLELSITPNRADLLSHLGLAREVAAGSGQRLLPSKWRLHESGPRIETLVRLQMEAPEHVRRYALRVVRGVKVGPSPGWLAQRLEALGHRSVNNVVDVTNYVMLELGIPLHAFDLAQVAQSASLPTVRVRLAEPGEVLVTLDGMERQLAEQQLLIADAGGPLALAGVMGGQRSEISERSTDVLLEAAAFAAPMVRSAARAHGLRTEASLRFGRGVDVAMVGRAAERAAQLLVECAGGEAAAGALDWQHKHEPSVEIMLPLRKVGRVLGIQLTPEAIVALLEPLQIRCHRRTEGALIFQVPSFRVDLTRDVDLLEEVARRHGLDNVPARLPSLAALAPAAGPPSQPQATSLGGAGRPGGRAGSAVRRSLLAAGLSECVHFAFAHAAGEAAFARDDRQPLALLNPLGEEQRCLRTTLLPGLLQALQRNVRRGRPGLAVFEVGTVFWQRSAAPPALPSPTSSTAPPLARAPGAAARQLPAALAERTAAYDSLLPHQQLNLACLLTGPRPLSLSWQQPAACDGHDLMGVWQAILAAYDLGRPAALRLGDVGHAPFNRHGCASLWLTPLGGAPEHLGQLGQLDPSYVRSYGWQQPVFALEISLAPIEAEPPRPLHGILPPKFPGTRRDLAIVAPKGLPAEAVRSYLAAQAAARLGGSVQVDVRIFDVYAGSHVPAGHVSLAYALHYSSASETLADDRISPAFAHLLQDVRARFGVEVRDGAPGGQAP